MSVAAPSPVVLITGAARRIGAAIACRLHDDGCSIALHCHQSRADADALAAALESRRPESTLVLQADLTDADALPTLVAHCIQRFGRLDALVNNAAAFSPASLDASDAALFDALMATNARAPFLLARAAAPHLRAAQGAVVNIGDLYAERPRADLVAYAASKAALLGLTRGLAVALAPDVRVNAVAPGAILWPEDGLDPALQARILEHTPLARAGRPEDIAAAVAWLLQDAHFSTGEVLHLDGGRML